MFPGWPSTSTLVSPFSRFLSSTILTSKGTSLFSFIVFSVTFITSILSPSEIFWSKGKLIISFLSYLTFCSASTSSTFDFKVGTKRYNGEKMHLEDDEILVIEGIHCLNDKLTSSIPMEQKYKIYISDLTVLNIDYCNRISTTDTRLIRRIVRDNNFRGYSALHTLRTWASVNRGENKNIFPYQENCDVMFNSSLIYELSVLKKQALPLLQEITNAEPEYAEAKRLVEFLKYFEEVDEELIPQNSLLREFVGGSIFGD